MEERSPNKYKWSKMLLVFTMIILFVRLWDLQVMKGAEMKRLSEQNRIRVKKILAPRGIIFDRNGKILADSRPSFNLYITPEDIKDFSQTVDGLARVLGIDREDIVDRLKNSAGLPASFPVKVKPDVSMDEVAKVEANRVYLVGVSIQIEPRRWYPYEKVLAHALGYVSEIGEEELKMKEYKGYTQGEFIGKYGLERMYEPALRGIDGERRVEVDATGREIRTLDIKEPIPGNNLYLNIDLEAQLVAEKALEGRKGGVIAVEPKNGAVLALASRPAFDPNKFSTGIKREDWKELIADKNHPLQNRVIQGRFPPGSTFKIALALKALDDGVINEKTSFSCRGGMPFGNRVFRCWKKEGHGQVDVHRAIVESCDVFFYNVGLKLGVDRIHEIGSAIGLGKITGIDLPGEKQGIIPSTEWKKKTYGLPWYEGETLSVAIGQGAVWLTPIELVQLSSFVANQGVTYKPQLVNRVVGPDGKTVKTFEPQVASNVKLKKETMTAVREAMKGVVNEQRGTAYGSRIQNVNMGGKTGTAQVGSMDTGKHQGDHAWFIAFAPVEDPAIAMTVLIEHGGHGASVAAPVAKAVTETFMKEKTVIREAKARDSR
jgi:penicillin-binding protein 2